MKILAAVYSHPEYYPPTQNAIAQLSSVAKEIIVISRNVKDTEGVYPKNVRLIKTGRFKPIRESEQSSLIWKVTSFIVFTYTLFKCVRKQKPEWVIAYDPIPLLAYSLAFRLLRKKPKLWYHNHDVLEPNTLKKYSVSWFAYRNEQNYFGKIDLFSLPSEERKQFFPMEKLKGQYFFIPNYPSILTDTKKINNQSGTKKIIKLIYQGHIGEGHGLNEVINFLKLEKTGLEISLTIIGHANDNFKDSLISLINELDLQNKVKILDPLPYQRLLSLTKQHDVGLAIHQPVNIAFRTAATSSNKIYEYLACGMPVILYDHASYRIPLNNRNWAYFTDLTLDSLGKILTEISGNFEKVSHQAESDFKNELNFERYFSLAKQYIFNKV
ncbi:MAG: glycosyltransferase [Pedobacter sp.]|nr:MAG: glycosyltransferase [Pedobacter sp.]